MRKLTALALLFLASCGRPDLADEKLSSRELNLEEFFQGRTVAHGQFQDRFGTVRRRFRVEIAGDWGGERLKLVEDFAYSDGGTEQRIWTLVKQGENRWQGTAAGVQGVAEGEERGDTFNWRYTIGLPAGDGTMRVSFDDWMWLLEDGRLLNKAYMSRFGVTLGEVIIFFEKP